MCSGDILSADGAWLFHGATPDSSMSYTSATLVQRKRWIVLCCSPYSYQELTNGSCWLVGQGRLEGTSMDSVHVLYCVNKGVRITCEFLGTNKWRGITVDIEENFVRYLKRCSTPSFRLFEKCLTGISVSQHHSPYTGSRFGNHKELRTIYRLELVNRVPGTVLENVLTNSLNNKVIARIDFYEQHKFCC
jgi:hypothetical protein